MRFLAICGNTIQVLSALRLRQTLYKNDYFSMVILDTLSNAEQLYHNISKMKIVNETAWYPNSFTGSGKKLSVKINLGLQAIPEEGALQNYEYDIIAAGNIFGVAEIYFHKSHKSNPEFYLLMDGLFNYVREEIDPFLHPSKIERLLHPVLRQLKGQYLFYESLGYAEDCFCCIGIPSLGDASVGEKQMINEAFGFYDLCAGEEFRAVYFEQAFAQDGMDMNDVPLLEPVAEKYGKDKVLVKPHPRSRNSSFKDKGYRIQADYGVPFEVVAMNCDISNKLLVTLGSTAAVTPYLLFKKTYRAFFLFKLRKQEYGLLPEAYTRFCKLIEELLSGEEGFFFPENEREYADILKDDMEYYEP